jgi:hypothetical protein
MSRRQKGRGLAAETECEHRSGPDGRILRREHERIRTSGAINHRTAETRPMADPNCKPGRLWSSSSQPHDAFGYIRDRPIDPLRDKRAAVPSAIPSRAT